jgi:hypothetical protein
MKNTKSRSHRSVHVEDPSVDSNRTELVLSPNHFWPWAWGVDVAGDALERLGLRRGGCRGLRGDRLLVWLLLGLGLRLGLLVRLLLVGGRLRLGSGLRWRFGLRRGRLRWGLVDRLSGGLAEASHRLHVGLPGRLAVPDGAVVLEEVLPDLGHGLGILLVLAVELLDQPGVRSEVFPAHPGHHSQWE